MSDPTPLNRDGEGGRPKAPWGSRFMAEWRHAFALNSSEPPLPPEDGAILDSIARAIVRRRLAAPALMLLESVRPLHFIGSQAFAFFEPLVSTVLPPEKCRRFRELTEHRQTIPALVDAIERLEAAGESR